MVVVVIFILIVGVAFFWYLERCPHIWELVDKGDLRKRRKDSNDEWRKYGYYTIHECAHCKKLKKEEIEIF